MRPRRERPVRRLSLGNFGTCCGLLLTRKALWPNDSRSLLSLRTYLSEEHVAHPGVGCVVAALGTDGARQAKPVRRAFANVAKGLLRLVDRKLHPTTRGPREPSDEALRLASTMVGAVVLARLRNLST